MDLISKERDQLLQRAARVWGLSFTAVSLICFVLPGATPSRVLLVGVPIYVVLGAFQFLMGWMRPTLWALLSVAAGIAIVGAVDVLSTTSPTPAAQASLIELTAAAVPAAALVLVNSWWRIVLLVVSFAAVGAAVELTAPDLATGLRTGALVVVGWALPALVGAWIMAAVPQAAKRIASIGRAHRAERQASELEAQRRQGARLLHDTVLATLTLLAHSGVGVTPDALREQAKEDAQLLRQLRLGTSPNVPDGQAQVGTGTSPVPVPEEPVLGTTLASVKQRFGRMGLQVSWHGAGQVLLPSHTLDAFLLALAECLENVRRHSGVTEAHVTITDDETTVRAMVTDSGVGFDIADIEATKLGFTESVVGRLREVGGTARLFSAPGSGTTVVLEVPRAEVTS
ncbi:sensor histidine kinase [Pseudolysinimonas sp.]|uniref:sensor histidine kinase n=1 Tax=Pseudolysinimonas sp. TaxID=2680009 RepID=UPI003F7E6D00